MVTLGRGSYMIYVRQPVLFWNSGLSYPTPEHVHVFSRNVVDSAEVARQLPQIRTLDCQTQERVRYDAAHRIVTYNEGDLVWLLTSSRCVELATKLLPRYAGTYRILKRLFDVTYCVEPVTAPRDRHTKLVDTMQVIRLKPYLLPKCSFPTIQAQEDPDST